MLFWICFWSVSKFRPAHAHHCRDLYIALKTDLPRRSWQAWTNETCWEQCFVVREDFALIMNNHQHTQYEWCIPAGRSGMCIIDQGIKVENNGEICDCTIMTRFPRILKDDKRPASPNDRSCTVDAIKERLSVPRGGKYTDFPVIWNKTSIPMLRDGKIELLDHFEGGHNVECAVDKDRSHEHCGSHGECIGRKPSNSLGSWIREVIHVTRYFNLIAIIIDDIDVYIVLPRWQVDWCRYIKEFNLFTTSPAYLFFKSNRSMDGLQLDESTDELPIVPYPLPPNKS